MGAGMRARTAWRCSRAMRRRHHTPSPAPLTCRDFRRRGRSRLRNSDQNRGLSRVSSARWPDPPRHVSARPRRRRRSRRCAAARATASGRVVVLRREMRRGWQSPRTSPGRRQRTRMRTRSRPTRRHLSRCPLRRRRSRKLKQSFCRSRRQSRQPRRSLSQSQARLSLLNPRTTPRPRSPCPLRRRRSRRRKRRRRRQSRKRQESCRCRNACHRQQSPLSRVRRRRVLLRRPSVT